MKIQKFEVKSYHILSNESQEFKDSEHSVPSHHQISKSITAVAISQDQRQPSHC